jgi:hypothetical protein
MSGDIISIDVPNNENVGYLKQQLICMFHDIPIDRIQLFSDVEMYPDTMQLTHYNLNNILMLFINPPPPILECFDMYQIDMDVGYTLNRTPNSMIVNAIPNSELYTVLVSKKPLPDDCLSFFTIETNVESIIIEVGILDWSCSHHEIIRPNLVERKLRYPQYGDSFFDIEYEKIDDTKLLVMYDPINHKITFFDGNLMNNYDIYHCNQCNVKCHLKLTLVCDLVKEHNMIIRESTREEMERFA